MPTQEEALADAHLGHEAALVLQLARPLIEETFDTLVTNAIAAFREGKLTGERAMVFVGKLDAIIGFREDLEARVEVGDAARAAIVEARSK